eukprot:g4559.t1
MKHNTKTMLALCTGRLLAVAVSAMSTWSGSAMDLEGAQYVDCFHDHPDDRVLGDMFEDVERMTPEVCRDYCTGLGAAFMAVQYAFQCFCSPDANLAFDRHNDITGEVPVCNMRCAGDEDQFCGGVNSFDLYKLTPQSTCAEAPVAAYEQCGGSSWTGSTCCDGGYECVVMGDGDCYSQCRPIGVVMSTPSTNTGANTNSNNVPVEEPTPSPIAYAEPTPAPVEDTTPAPVEDPTPTPVEYPTPAPVEEPTPTPVEDPTPAPVEDPTPTPVEDPAPAPVEEPTPAPVVAEEPEEPIEPSTDVDEIVPTWPVPDFIFDFDSCVENAWMCCWTASAEDGMAIKDNTDVCRSATQEFPGDSEGHVHCHGFAWADNNSDLHIRGLAEFVKNFNHEGLRGYYGNIPGGDTCGCVENMPEVSKSDCNTYNEIPGGKRFTSCEDNNLRDRYQHLNPNGTLTNLVGKPPPPKMKHNTKTFLALCTVPLLAVAVSAMSSSSDDAMDLEGAEYFGCFHDNQDDRVLRDRMQDKEGMTLEVCRDYCTGLGAAFMAVQYAFQCFCSPDANLDYDRHNDITGEVPVCNKLCVGDEDQYCGGVNSFDLYELVAGTHTSSNVTAEDEPTPSPIAYAEPTPAPVEDTTPTPVEYPTPAPVEDPTPTPVEDPTPAPVEDPTPTPVEDPTPAPVEEPTPAPVVVEEPEEPIEPSTDVDEIVPTWPVPDFIFDFDSCVENAFMCCWTASAEDGMAIKDNTDVCRSATQEFPGDSEGHVHCHGFAWADNNSDLHIRGLAEFVKNFNHEGLRGYYGNIPGGDTCGCVENMPEVSKSDCNTYNEIPGGKRFTSCEDNNLRDRYQHLNPNGTLTNLVGKCDNA